MFLVKSGGNTVTCLLRILIVPFHRRDTALYFVMNWDFPIRISHFPWLAVPQQHTVYCLYFLLESIFSHARPKQQFAWQCSK